VLAGLGFGFAASQGNFRGSLAATGLPSYKTPGQQANFFTYTNTFGNGDRTRISPQAYYYYGPVGVIAEYARVSQDVTNNANLSRSLDNDAWQIAASWLVTGEDASFKGVKPKQVFDANNGGWGAWELVARYEENNIDSGAFSVVGQTRFASPVTNAKSASSWGGGVNWYLNQNVRLALNYERTSFEAGGGGTIAAPLDRPDEKILFTRLQLSY
jgi:phosphate-selective porin OprO/OprP